MGLSHACDNYVTILLNELIPRELNTIDIIDLKQIKTFKFKLFSIIYLLSIIILILFLISEHGMRETLNERNINVTDLVYTAINFNDG